MEVTYRWDHSDDADCTLGADDCCIYCGVWHSDPCPECGGRGYHKPDCSVIDVAEERQM